MAMTAVMVVTVTAKVIMVLILTLVTPLIINEGRRGYEGNGGRNDVRDGLL